MSEKETIYADIISDIALEISISKFWRNRIFNLKENNILEISYEDKDKLPEYIRNVVVENKLIFNVQIVNECDEKYDDELVVFKFWSKEFPHITSYSGNNPNMT